MSDYHDVLRHLVRGEGYALNTNELDQTCAQHPDPVCALLAAACTIATADAQIATLTTACNLLAEVHADGKPDTVLSMREHLDRVVDALTRALAQRDKATARLRRACDTLTDLGTGLITRPGSTPPADHPTTPTPLRPGHSCVEPPNPHR